MVYKYALIIFTCWISLNTAAYAQQGERVRLELLLALDASNSVEAAEFRLQRQGIAHAFQQPVVIDAIQAASERGIAVGVMQWSSFTEWTRPASWMKVHDRASAETFGQTVENLSRLSEFGSTAIGRTVNRGVNELRNNRFEGKRQIIDIIGNGRSNVGVEPSHARDRAVSKDVTVNGLAILTDDPELDRYFLNEVVGGPGAFVITANSFEDFEKAIERKLLREILGGQAGVPNSCQDRWSLSATAVTEVDFLAAP